VLAVFGSVGTQPWRHGAMVKRPLTNPALLTVGSGRKASRRETEPSVRAQRQHLSDECGRCFQCVTCPAADEQKPIVFWQADMCLLLQCLSRKCRFWREKIERWAAPERQGAPVRVVLAHDETTGGNVLATLQS
jgi:hypothetical protein